MEDAEDLLIALILEDILKSPPTPNLLFKINKNSQIRTAPPSSFGCYESEYYEVGGPINPGASVIIPKVRSYTVKL